MPRRKKRFMSLNLNPKSSRSVFALLLMLAGSLSFLSYVGHLASFDNVLYSYLQRFAGAGAFLLPVTLFFSGMALTHIRWRIAQARIFWGLAIFNLGLILFFHVILNGDNSSVIAQEGGGGGIIGLVIAGKLVAIFSVFGAFLVAVAVLLVGVLVLFNTSLEELGEWTGNVFGPVAKAVVAFTQSMKRTVAAGNDNGNALTVQVDEPENTSGLKINKPKGEVIAEKQAKKNDLVDTKEPKQPVTIKTDSEQIGTLTIQDYEAPSLSLLSNAKEIAADRGDVEKNAGIIERTLDSFGVQAKVAEVNLGPAVTQYALSLTEGTKITKITALANDLALALAAPTGAVRIEAPIPGKKLVGIEVPNYSSTLVTMRNSLLSDNVQNSKAKLMTVLGQDVSGETEVADLAKWPHVLIAGATGSGKSVLLHSIIVSLLYAKTPDELQFLFIDPKRVELTQYDGIPHLLRSVIVDPDKAVNAFKWAVHEMEHRYKLFQQVPGARDLASFNEATDTTKLPYIVIVVDEMADLMAYAKNEAEGLITRLAQMSRATGIHLVLATQRPSVDVITGLIKANIPTRIALNVTSVTDSRVVLDGAGAEKLIGKGDMLYLPPDAAKPRRVQGVFVSPNELLSVIEYLKQFSKKQLTQEEAVEMIQQDHSTESELLSEQDNVGMHAVAPTASGRSVDFEEPDDDKFNDAVAEIVNHDRASASLLQRRLKIGYARAARLLDELEGRGLVSAPDGSNPREVHKTKIQEYLNQSGARVDQTFM